MRAMFRMFILAVVVCVAVSSNAQWTSSGGTTTTNDNVGIGTPGAPQAKLHVFGSEMLLQNMPPDASTPSVTMFTLANRAASGLPYMWRFATASSSGGSGLFPNTLDLYEYPSNASMYCCFLRMAIRPVTVASPKLIVVDGAGNFGIGVWTPSATLHVNGDARFEGTVTGTNIQAHYQDVAEWVPSRSDLAPGTVVVLDASLGNGVTASSSPYDTSVAGVVSAQPGLILGEAAATKEMVATTGRVKVRVDATSAPIAVGDLLVTSDRRGVAMKSQPVDIHGRKFHQPGTIIGKALEPLAEGEGEILVLLSLQ
jgi:hypothetical protein